jgi:hypothetical protein
MNIVSGTVYHILFPILIDGSTTSPNMSFGTNSSSPASHVKDRRLLQAPATRSMREEGGWSFN